VLLGLTAAAASLPLAVADLVTVGTAALLLAPLAAFVVAGLTYLISDIIAAIKGYLRAQGQPVGVP
jgi:hypothetical protein